MSMYSLAMPTRRSCAICGRREAAASLHLTTVHQDGEPTRACDVCRDQRSWFCQNRGCRKEQVGRQYTVNALAYCARCAAAAGPLVAAIPGNRKP